jgi:alanine racemase
VKSWVEISEQRLKENYRVLTAAAGAGISVLAVVKADAYGHDAALCAPVLAQAGAEWLGVTDAAEGALVRNALAAAGIAAPHQPRILVMNECLPEDAEALVRHRLTPVVSTIRQMQALARYSPTPFAVHLEIDTGMSRQGVSMGEPLAAVLDWLQAHRDIVHLEGVMTHFASAEIACSHQSAAQRGRFNEALLQVASAGLRPEWIHAGNSSSIDNEVDAVPGLLSLARLAHTYQARAMVRTGLGLYGYCLPIEREQDYTGAAPSRVAPQLTRVMTWKARIIGLREVAAGARIGYNGTFTAQQPMRLALLPVGYADGLRRELSSTNDSGGGSVTIGGQRAPIIGRVSMNLTVVDVTALASVAIGDEVIMLGDGITAEDHARIARTIPYEIVCAVRSSRVLKP